MKRKAAFAIKQFYTASSLTDGQYTRKRYALVSGLTKSSLDDTPVMFSTSFSVSFLISAISSSKRYFLRSQYEMTVN